MTAPRIQFTMHAILKFEALRRHGLEISQAKVREIVEQPDSLSEGYANRRIAQGRLDERRVLRVVYEEARDSITVITFYPGKRSRYEHDSL